MFRQLSIRARLLGLLAVAIAVELTVGLVLVIGPVDTGRQLAAEMAAEHPEDGGTEIAAALDRQHWLGLTAVALGAVVIALIGFPISFGVSRSIERLTERVGDLADGRFLADRPLPDDAGRELVDLAERTRTLAEVLTSFVRQVQHSGIQVTSTATEIGAGGKHLEESITQHVVATNEVLASARQISATAVDLATTMEEVVHFSNQAAHTADEGQQSLNEMEAAMNSMETASTSISEKLDMISEKTGNIRKVVVTINKVAEQTNLLSLNAGIEAEKAGEYGLGFSVVAREIRRLADQTAVATFDIEEIVKEMRGAVTSGVMSVEKFGAEVRRGVDVVNRVGRQLASVIDKVQALTPRFDSVNEGMKAQSVSAQQISEAMTQLTEAAELTSRSLTGTRSSLERLEDVIGGLQREVARFQIET